MLLARLCTSVLPTLASKSFSRREAPSNLIGSTPIVCGCTVVLAKSGKDLPSLSNLCYSSNCACYCWYTTLICWIFCMVWMYTAKSASSLTVSNLLLDLLLLGQLWLRLFCWLIFYSHLLALLKFSLRLNLLSPLLLVGKMSLLFLHLCLLINNLLFAWFLTIVMAAWMFFLVPSMTALARLHHQSDCCVSP